MKVKCLNKKKSENYLSENDEYEVIIEGGDSYYLNYRKTIDNELLYGWFDKKLFKII